MTKYLLTFSLFSLLVSSGFAQCNVYGIKEYFSDNFLESSQLVTVNELTGEWTTVGPQYDVEITNYANLHFNEKEGKYISLNYEESQLHIFDVKTGVLTTKTIQIGEDGEDYLSEVILDYRNNILYGITASSNLVKINTSTGGLTTIGAISGLLYQEQDPYTSFYDHVSGKLFVVGVSEVTDVTGGYTIFIVDPANPANVEFINTEDEPILFNDKLTGKIYSVNYPGDAIEIREFDRTSIIFKDFISLEDEYSMSPTGGNLTYNSISKNLILTGTTIGEDNDYQGYYVISLTDKDYIVHQSSYTTDVLGFLYGGCGDVIQSMVDNATRKIKYTNPTHDVLKIALNEQDRGTVLLYDVNGNEVRSLFFTGSEISIVTDNLISGVYYFEIKTENGLLQRNKIVKL